MQWINKEDKNLWTAIRSSGERVCIAQVLRSDTAKPLVKFANIEEVDIKNASQLKALTAKYKLNKSQCSLVLDGSDFQLLQLEKPNVPAEEQHGAVHWKLKDMLDYPIETATVDLLEIPSDPAYSNRQSFLYAIAVKNDRVKQLSNQLTDSKINLKAIDVQVTAQRNIASLLEQKDRGLAMLSFNHSGGLLTFTFGGELYHARFIEIEEAHTPNAYERIALELQRSLDHFDREFPFIALTKLLVAPFGERDAFTEHLKAALYLPVEGFELSEAFDFVDQDNMPDLHMQASLFPALGAALREEVPK